MNLSGEKVILRTIEEQDQELLLNLIRDQETIKILNKTKRLHTFS